MNGIQEVSGSIPLISTKCALRHKKTLKSYDFKVFSFPKVENSGDLQADLCKTREIHEISCVFCFYVILEK